METKHFQIPVPKNRYDSYRINQTVRTQQIRTQTPTPDPDQISIPDPVPLGRYKLGF